MKLAQLMAIGLTVGTIGVSVATVSADEVRDGSTAASVTLKRWGVNILRNRTNDCF
ncbi:hypothetical protein [Brochothrix campestris]|uniref:hypothetical protein n=1 Tax=Brochothrix campestris TaxID=2757 RepID=UPI0004B01F6C|nr:hypothetical protein [Brochothrix campestris]